MVKLELVSKELNHFGVIAGLFQQIGGHSSRFVLFCSFWSDLTPWTLTLSLSLDYTLAWKLEAKVHISLLVEILGLDLGARVYCNPQYTLVIRYVHTSKVFFEVEECQLCQPACNNYSILRKVVFRSLGY